MKLIQTTIEDKQKEKFSLFAKREKMKPAALLRQIVLIYLGVKERDGSSSVDDEFSEKSSNEFVLKTSVNKEIFDEFAAVAKSQGLSNAGFLRVLIDERLAKIQDGSIKSSIELLADPEEIEIEKVSVYLPSFIRKKAVLCGRRKGMKLSRWIASIVQSNIMKEPVMTHNEINQLNASIRELAAIGRNLNQIAKALNENFHETDRLKLSELTALKNVIDNNKLKIYNLVKNSMRSWEIDE